MAFLGRLYREGNTLKIENFSGNPKIFFVEQFGFNNFLTDDILRWIDILAENGVNGMRVFGFWPFSMRHEEEPYVKTASGYDLNRFNEPYFEHLRRWVTYANEKSVVVMFELFDSCGIWNVKYAPYNPFYQVVGTDHKAFSDLNNRSLVNVQKQYIQKVVETIKPNLNVIFGIMNEFKGDKRWYYEMSRYVKSLAPEYLISGSEEDSPAVDDPNVDMWFVHTGRYHLSSGTSDVRADAEDVRRKTGTQKIIGYSTDGFGSAGKIRENPTDMRRLAQDVVNTGLTLFGFLDHKAYNEIIGGSVSQLNVETYQAIVEVFQPTPPPTPSPRFKLDEQALIGLRKRGVPTPVISNLQQLKDKEYFTQEQLIRDVEAIIGVERTALYGFLIVRYAMIERPPDGFLDIFNPSRLPSLHPGAYVERGGKAIRPTVEQGFLCFGQYRKGYPTIPLQALFSILIDNNTADDRNILILDVYDHHSDRVQGKRVITRKDFPKANDFSLFRFDFTPPSKDANMEFRIYYMGHSYILVNKIAVIDPEELSIQDASEIPTIFT